MSLNTFSHKSLSADITNETKLTYTYLSNETATNETGGKGRAPL